jgi:PelA/Pel-15E family pectate lyase
MRRSILCCAAILFFTVPSDADDASQLRVDAAAAIEKAGSFYYNDVARHGGYVYFYSLDLKQRWGEGVASKDQVWVQPPGTPTVGMAFLRAWAATADQLYLDAARDAAYALAFGQLRNGGWTNSIDLSGKRSGQRYSGGNNRRDGTSSLDDGQTQSAIQLVIQVDKALNFKDETIHSSAMLALDSLLAAQFPNGGFPQGWKDPVTKPSVIKASYPEYDWRTEGRIKNYWDMYTLNDNVCGYVADTLIDAHKTYGDERYLQSLRKLGDFFILAQMPEPQRGWAQQYNYEMKPIWARKFEPAAMAGDETQEAIETLIKIAAATGNDKYLDPIADALAWLKQSLLPDGKIARYYELKSNRPLYMSRRGKTYSLTYDDSQLPSHYGWKWPSRIDELEARLQQHKTGVSLTSFAATGKSVRQIISTLDSHGRWVSTHSGERLVGQAKMPVGAKYLSSEIFSTNLIALSDFLTRTKN